MENQYLTYYFRDLCVKTFPSFGTEYYFDMSLFEHFYTLLVRLNKQENFDYIFFLNQYVKKIENAKYRNKFDLITNGNYDKAKDDFFELQTNIYQIVLIYSYKDQYLNFNDNMKALLNNLEEFTRKHNLLQVVKDILKKALIKLLDVIDETINIKYPIEKYNTILYQTLMLSRAELGKLEIDENILNKNEYKFKKAKNKVLKHLKDFSDIIEDTFENKKKIRHITSVKYYMSFLLHDEIISIDIDGTEKEVLIKFYDAILYAYKFCINFIYFKSLYDKLSLEDVINQFHPTMEVCTIEDIQDKRQVEGFFRILNSITTRQDFKHLPLVVLGDKLSLDANTVKKISVAIDNNGVNSDANSKNHNVVKKYNELRYSTNMQAVFDLDYENMKDFLNLFRSYKTKIVYRASFTNLDGSMSTKDFDSVDDYKRYIKDGNIDLDIEYSIKNYLTPTHKRLYYNSLLW